MTQFGAFGFSNNTLSHVQKKKVSAENFRFCILTTRLERKYEKHSLYFNPFL